MASTKATDVVIYIPMILRKQRMPCWLVIAYRGDSFGGIWRFASHNLAVRMDDAEAKMVITVDAGLRVASSLIIKLGQ